jgi:hypothetical protein
MKSPTRCQHTVDLILGESDRERWGVDPWSPWSAVAVQAEIWPCLVRGDKHEPLTGDQEDAKK